MDAVYRDAFAAHGISVPAADVDRAVRQTWREVAERRARGEETWAIGAGEGPFWRRFVSEVFARVGGGELPDDLLAGLVEHFRDPRNWRVYPEVPGALEALKAGGLKLLVVSNWDSSLPPLLSKVGLAAFFDDVVVSALVGVSKPFRGIFDEAVRRAGVSHPEALHVGDSLHDDYLGAKDAGLEALLLDRAGSAPEGGGVETVASLTEVVRRVLPPQAPRENPGR